MAKKSLSEDEEDRQKLKEYEFDHYFKMLQKSMEPPKDLTMTTPDKVKEFNLAMAYFNSHGFELRGTEFSIYLYEIEAHKMRIIFTLPEGLAISRIGVRLTFPPTLKPFMSR